MISDGRSLDLDRRAVALLEPVQRYVLADVLHVPAVGLVARGDVLGEATRRRAGELDLVVVVEDDQPARGRDGPASDDASEEMPSWMSPSEAITNVQWSTTSWPVAR